MDIDSDNEFEDIEDVPAEEEGGSLIDMANQIYEEDDGYDDGEEYKPIDFENGDYTLIDMAEDMYTDDNGIMYDGSTLPDLDPEEGEEDLSQWIME